MDKHPRGICLRVGVDQQHLVALKCQPGCKINGSGTFCNSSFLVRNRDDHGVVFRLTYSVVIRRSRAESVIFRSFANSCNVFLSFPGATKRMTILLMLFLGMLAILTLNLCYI